MQAQDFKGLYAIMPTPARPGADRLDATATVDLDETARMVDALIADGASGLIAVGTTGECATLAQADYDAFVTCLIDVVRRRVPLFVGATAMGGHEVARRLRLVKDRGADGTLLGLPMWQPMTTPAVVDFYRQASEFAPELAIMVYANARAFRYNFPPEFWEEVVRVAPTVVAAKMSRPKDLHDLLRRTDNRINFMPNEMTVLPLHRLAPQAITACWATAASMGPQPIVALMDAIGRGDLAAADTWSSRIAWANEPVEGLIRDPEIFAVTTVQIEKIRINAAGYCNGGPVRSPYAHIADDYLKAAQECGRRWSTLSAEMQQAAA